MAKTHKFGSPRVGDIIGDDKTALLGKVISAGSGIFIVDLGPRFLELQEDILDQLRLMNLYNQYTTEHELTVADLEEE